MNDIIGQAYDKAQTHIYTWHVDGSVTRHAVFISSRDVTSGFCIFYETSGFDEPVTPPPTHNLVEFWALVPPADMVARGALNEMEKQAK